MSDLKKTLVGLVSYKEDDNSIFFGREKEVENLLQVIQNNKLIALTGPSGSGKTSLINAGLIPRLKKGFLAQSGKEWAICQFRPGVNPIENLIFSLTNSGVLNKDLKSSTEDFSNYRKIIDQDNILSLSKIYKDSEINNKKNLLIIVDQFEDIFVFNKIAKYRQNDDKLLLDIISRTVKIKEVSVYFLICLQTEYTSKLVNYSKLQELFNKSQYAIHNIDNSGLKTIIKNSLISNGIGLNQEAFNFISNEISKDLSLLPNVQFLLCQLLKGPITKNYIITLEKIKALGSIENVIAEKFNEIYDSFSNEDQNIFSSIVRATMNFENQENQILNNNFESILSISGVSNINAVRILSVFKNELGDSINIFENKISGMKRHKMTISFQDIMCFKYSENRNWKLEQSWIEDEKVAFKNFNNYAVLADKYSSGEISLMTSPELEMAVNWKNLNIVNKNWAKKYSYNYEKTINYINKSEESFLQKKNTEEKRIKRKKIITRRVITAISTLTILAIFMAIGAYINKGEAEKNFKDANLAKDLALEKSNEAQTERKLAVENEKLALREKKLADKAKLEAQKYLKIAQKERKEAQKSAIIASEQTEKAKESEKVAKEKQTEALIQKDNATRATLQAEKLKQKALLETEFYPIMLRLERLIDESSDPSSNLIVIKNIEEAIEKFYEYKQLIKETDSGKITSEGLFVLLQTSLKALENKSAYNESSMLIKKTNQGSSIRSVSVFNDNIIAMGGDDKNLYVLNGASRNEIPPIKINERIREVVIANADDIYVGTFKGNVFKINLNDSNLSRRKENIHQEATSIRDLYHNNENNRLYIVSSRGVSSFNGLESTQIISGKDISSSYFDKNTDELFISTIEGLFIIENDEVITLALDNINFESEKITAISRTAEHLVIGTNSGKLFFYKIIQNNQSKFSLQYDNKVILHLSEITKLFYDIVNNNLYSASLDNQVLKFNSALEDLSLMTTSVISLNGHEKWVWDINMIKDLNGNNLLITADENGNLISWFYDIDELVNKVKSLITKN